MEKPGWVGTIVLAGRFLRRLHAVCHVRAHHTGFCAPLVLSISLVWGAVPAPAAVTEAWVHRYSNALSNSTDLAYKLVRDGAGDVFVIGDTIDGLAASGMLIVKYSRSDGSVLWQRRNPALLALHPIPFLCRWLWTGAAT